MSKSYDLSTSTKWANLADGDHVVKLRAKGARYGSSSFSNSVTVKKGATGETWVLNESISLGDFGYNQSYVIDFISNSTEYKAMWTSRDSETQDITLHYTRKSDNYYQSVYVTLGTPGSPSGWINGEAYRTITFSTPPTGDLLTWLQANGTKQGGG